MGVSDLEGKAAQGSSERVWATERVSNQEPMKKPIVAQIISFCATRRLRYYDGQSARRLYL